MKKDRASAAKTAVVRAAGVAGRRLMSFAFGASGRPPKPFPAQVVDVSAVSGIRTEGGHLQPLRPLFRDDTLRGGRDHESGRDRRKSATKPRFLGVCRFESPRPKTEHAAA